MSETIDPREPFIQQDADDDLLDPTGNALSDEEILRDALDRIKLELKGIADEDRTTAEKNIWKILKETEEQCG